MSRAGMQAVVQMQNEELATQIGRAIKGGIQGGLAFLLMKFGVHIYDDYTMGESIGFLFTLNGVIVFVCGFVAGLFWSNR